MRLQFQAPPLNPASREVRYGSCVTSNAGPHGGCVAARIEVAVRTVADLDRRLGQIDSAIEEAAKRGKTNTALSAMEGQRRARAGLTSERNEAAASKLSAPHWPPKAAGSR